MRDFAYKFTYKMAPEADSLAYVVLREPRARTRAHARDRYDLPAGARRRAGTRANSACARTFVRSVSLRDVTCARTEVHHVGCTMVFI